MKAPVYHGPGQRAWETVPDPKIEVATDAIVRIDTSTICGTDLHILKGDVPDVEPGRILGHLIDGLQAELARVPFADTSLHKVPERLTDEDVIFLADILPTSYEVGVLAGRVEPGDTVAIVGAGPIGLAAVMTAKLFTPGRIVLLDVAEARLEKARDFGADVTINNGAVDAVAAVMELTDGLGADVAIEAVGVPETFIVDGKGVIRFQHVGPIEQNDVQDILAKLEEVR